MDIDTILFYLFIQCSSFYANAFRRLSHAPIIGLQMVDKIIIFIQRHALSEIRNTNIRRIPIGNVLGFVLELMLHMLDYRCIRDVFLINHNEFTEVSQLANITRPAVAEQMILKRSEIQLFIDIKTMRIAGEEEAHEQQDILSSISQRRQLDDIPLDAIKEILPESIGI